MVDVTELEALVKRLRALGVVQYSANGVRLVILPAMPADEAPEEESKPRQPLADAKRGPDGLTKDEQMEYYGRVLDSDL